MLLLIEYPQLFYIQYKTDYESVGYVHMKS